MVTLNVGVEMISYYLTVKYIENGFTVLIERDGDLFNVSIDGVISAAADTVKEAEYIATTLIWGRK